MKDDLISRQAAIDALNKRWGIGTCILGDDIADESAKVLNALPPAQPQWIPCSERLPTENDSYLVWMPFAPEGHHITVAEWCGSYWNIKTPITTWMPLPKPWEREKP